jgi:thioredoxin-like negative regulator of GroEL
MQNIDNLTTLTALKDAENVLLILFGGKDCSICQAIKPKLISLMTQHYPKAKLAYVDCHSVTHICAQNGVFTLPTLQVYFNGQRFIEEVHSFSLQKVVKDMAKPYGMLFND